MKRPDCVYYWMGGNEVGEWHKCTPINQPIEEARQELLRMGYYALNGYSNIGRPNTPPPKTWFE